MLHSKDPSASLTSFAPVGMTRIHYTPSHTPFKQNYGILDFMADKKSLRILLVDDEQDMCDSMADVLRLDADYDITLTTSPHEGLRLAKGEEFDLIMVDYEMPEMDGVELVEAIKAVKPDALIFVLTAFISHKLIKEAKEKGAGRVLSKFMWPDELLQIIREALARC